MLDYIVWGKDIQDADYVLYTEDCLGFLPHDIRAAYEQATIGQSILTIVTQPNISPSTRDTVQLILQQLLVFRKHHLRAAATAYMGSGDHEFKTGSGGYSIQHLGRLYSLTGEALRRLRRTNGTTK